MCIESIQMYLADMFKQTVTDEHVYQEIKRHPTAMRPYLEERWETHKAYVNYDRYTTKCPPYAQIVCGRFIEKLRDERQRMIVMGRQE
jgi:hypothetical protein